MDFDDTKEWVEDHHKLLSYLVMLPALWLASTIAGVSIASIPRNIFFGSMERYQAICLGFWFTSVGVMIINLFHWEEMEVEGELNSRPTYVFHRAYEYLWLNKWYALPENMPRDVNWFMAIVVDTAEWDMQNYSQKKTSVSKFNCPRCDYAWDEVSESENTWET